MAATPSTPPAPLSGILVADFTHFIAGPFATLVLADFGADVIKIESEGGDAFRGFPPFLQGESVPHLWVNRNKRSVALDLKSARGKEVALDLIRHADVLVENFSNGVMDRLGLGWAEAAAINPRLVYCSISAYGREGPHAQRLGFDAVVQAESGFMSMTGFPYQQPTRAGPPIMDLATAMLAANAVQAALIARHSSGKGQRVEVNLLGTAVNMLGNFHMSYLATGRMPIRSGNTQSTAAPVGCFETMDGTVYLACSNDRIFQRLMTQGLERPDVAEHADFKTNSQRVANQPRLMALIAEIFATRPRAYWLERLQGMGVPCGAVRNIAESFDSTEVKALGLVDTIEHLKLGPIPNLRLPVRFSETPVGRMFAAPVLAADTVEVLQDVLGYTPEHVAELKLEGAFGTAAHGNSTA